MNDFEVHPIGTAIEIKLSRDLARSIDEIIKQYGEVIPQPVRAAYNRLNTHYQYQMQSEEL